MTNRDHAPLTRQRPSNLLPLPVAKTEGLGLSPGMRFFQDGHWWEVDGRIHGRATSYYKCKPVCGIESRFYTEAEIRQALNEQLTAMNTTMTMNHTIYHSEDRGTGRLTAELRPRALTQSHGTVARRRLGSGPAIPTTGKSEPLKILLVGTRDTVKRAIAAFHSLGYANTADWSPFQPRPNSKEVLSILVQKI